MTISASMTIEVTAEYGVVSRHHTITVRVDEGQNRGAIEQMTPKEVVELITTLTALVDACQEEG